MTGTGESAAGGSAAGGSAAGGSEADDRLGRLLGGAPTAWLVQRARARLEGGRPLAGTVTLAGATVEQRRAAERLTGRPARSGASLSLSLPEVDRILRESGAAPGGLAEAVTRLTGPVRDRSRDQADSAAAWADAFAPLDEAVDSRDELAAWRAWLGATGVVRRLAPDPAAARSLLAQLAAVLRRLPSRGVPVGRLAAECCGDAHALDDGQPTGTLALSLARALAGLPFAADGTADSRRAAWAAVGVHLDDLSSLVLCLGLPGDSRTGLGRVLALHREAGQPAMLTLRQLRCHDEPLRAGLVRICENPVVVAAAADELGADCPPLVCVSGQPSAAGWRLLDLLAAGDAAFGYHGDFDWGGVRIASAVRTRLDRATARWRPWRYDRNAYDALAATVATATSLATSSQLTGEQVATPWDPHLAAAMAHRALRIEEELALDTLLTDLAATDLTAPPGRRGMTGSPAEIIRAGTGYAVRVTRMAGSAPVMIPPARHAHSGPHRVGSYFRVRLRSGRWAARLIPGGGRRVCPRAECPGARPGPGGGGGRLGVPGPAMADSCSASGFRITWTAIVGHRGEDAPKMSSPP